MLESVDLGDLVVSLGLYAVGIALAMVAAAALVEAIELVTWLALVLFLVGLALVVFVHERLGGPI